LSYSNSFANQVADMELTNVTVGLLNNNSVCGELAPGPGSIPFRYSNYTNLSGPTFSTGATITFSLTQTTCGSNAINYFMIYIDWNQDGDFSDLGEEVYRQINGVNANQTQTGSFLVPSSALTGNTRMRVINTTGSFGSTNYAETSYSWGETEDYCVTIVPCTAPSINAISPP
jgi:hypothetical protein